MSRSLVMKASRSTPGCFTFSIILSPEEEEEEEEEVEEKEEEAAWVLLYISLKRVV